MALITDMDIPLGYAIGNSLEVIEAVHTLQGKGPKDLTEVCLKLASNMLFLAGKGTEAECRELAIQAVESGAALEKLVAMVEAQGGDASVIRDTEKFAKAKYSYEFKASKSGYITHINTEQCGIASVALGAGRETKESEIDYAAGIILVKKFGDHVEAGEVLATFYAENENYFKNALNLMEKAYTIEDTAPVIEPLVFARVGKDSVERYDQ